MGYYNVPYTNQIKPAIKVNDQALNTETSLSFVGKNYSGYSVPFATNFLHLLENFANNTPPISPVQGQLWYDTNTGVNLLKIFDGTTWGAAGSVKKASTAPLVGNSIVGDLWVDTNNHQLYLFSGSTWLLIGPQYSSGMKTGPLIEGIVDTTDKTHSVVSLYANNNRIVIVSNESFVPKSVIQGFVSIQTGVNLASTAILNGTASQAAALLVNNEIISSTNFLRSDKSVPSNVQLSIRTDNGINIGNDLSFSISANSSSYMLTSKPNGKSIDFFVNATDNILHLSANSKIGINNNNPSEALDVNGNITTNGMMKITSEQDSSDLQSGSIITNGGLSVKLKSNFGGVVNMYSPLKFNNLDINNIPLAGSVAQPGYNTHVYNTTTQEYDLINQAKYDIGSITSRFRNIYADQYVGNFNGTFTGTLTGNISGSASKLASPTIFSLAGDVTSDTIAFNGQTSGSNNGVNGSAVFNTTITSSLISSKDEVSDSRYTDYLLVYRTGSGSTSGLKKQTKDTFLSNVPVMPVGAIIPFAGEILPAGYLLCDGSEVSISSYISLFNVIQYSYKTRDSLLGSSTFGLPDLRGRFPLGRDNMTNVDSFGNPIQVPSKDNERIEISTWTASNRVSDSSADIIGNHAGSESKQLSVSNIPDHKHVLKSDSGSQYYAAGLPNASPDTTADPNTGMPNSSSAYGIRNTGTVDVPPNVSIGQSFNIMNPYLTINYIIFTGVL